MLTMRVLLAAIFLTVVIFPPGARTVDSEGGCPCSTTESDIVELLIGVEGLDLTEAGQTPVLEVSGDAFSFLDGDDGPVFAATRAGCGKVVVSATQETFIDAGTPAIPLMLSILNWLSSAGGKEIGILRLSQDATTILTVLLEDTCYNVTTIPEDQRTNLDPYDILISHSRIDYDSMVDAAVVEAVNAGKSLFLLTRTRRNNNDLSGAFGITITDELTDVNVNVTLPSQPDPTDCMSTMVDYGNKEPAEIKSIADNGFVVQEGIGAAYYGAGRVLLIGNQAIIQNRDLSRKNIDFIKEAISFVQDCNNCSCEIGYMMRGTPFRRLSKTLSDEGCDVPAVEITEDEMCTSCCVGINLGVIRGNNVDAEAVQVYVYNGGCLILTCPDASTNVRPINDLLEPFGLEIPKRKG